MIQATQLGAYQVASQASFKIEARTDENITAMTAWTRSKGSVSDDPASVFPEPTKKKKQTAIAGQVFGMEKVLDRMKERFQIQIQDQLGQFKREFDQKFKALSLSRNEVQVGEVIGRENPVGNPMLLN
ncbi:unnamed protein product [Linum trigynum]|uniref:Uncharacterized protein n=1 Tax=Linum trigynum TaxID=586398 RepID=A0AAV2E6V4_9ROSI